MPEQPLHHARREADADARESGLGAPPIAEALRLIRVRAGLTQVAASKLPGAPDYRTLSHWETRRAVPRLPLLYSYLGGLGLDFRDLQGAFEQIEGQVAGSLDPRLTNLERRQSEAEGQIDRTAESLAEIERRQAALEARLERTGEGPPGR